MTFEENKLYIVKGKNEYCDRYYLVDGSDFVTENGVVKMRKYMEIREIYLNLNSCSYYERIYYHGVIIENDIVIHYDQIIEFGHPNAILVFENVHQGYQSIMAKLEKERDKLSEEIDKLKTTYPKWYHFFARYFHSNCLYSKKADIILDIEKVKKLLKQP